MIKKYDTSAVMYISNAGEYVKLSAHNKIVRRQEKIIHGLITALEQLAEEHEDQADAWDQSETLGTAECDGNSKYHAKWGEVARKALKNARMYEK